MDLLMGAVGVQGVAREAPPEGGLEVKVTSDVLGVRTSSEATTGLAGAEGHVTRLRLGLEGTWLGARLTPRLEAGVRHDGGDAETGFGIDIGGGLAWSDPERGLSAELSARGLLTHEAEGFRERGIAGSLGYEARPGTGRGLSVTLAQRMGAQASGGMDTLLGHTHLEGLGAPDSAHGLGERQLELKLGYGVGAFGDRFTATPQAGLTLSNHQREIRLGWHLGLARAGPVSMEIGVTGTRSETHDDADAVKALMLHGQIHW